MDERPKRTLSFDTAIYRLTAIKKAAYRFSDRATFAIEPGPGNTVTVRLSAMDRLTNLDRLEADFTTEVLDQDLREIVAAETETVRNLILAQAFSQTSLLDPVGEQANYLADPLGIARPDGAPDADGQS